MTGLLARLSPSRPLWVAGLAVLLATLALDVLEPGGSVRANGILDEHFFPAFSDFDLASGGRLGHTASRIELPGFGPGQEVRVALVLSREAGPLLLDGTTPVEGARVEATTHADAAGWIALRLSDPTGRRRGLFVLKRVEAGARAAVPPGSRLLLELGTLGLLGLLVAWTTATPAAQAAAYSVLGGLFVLALGVFRPYLIAHLPLLLVLGGAGVLFLAAAEGLGVPRWSSGLLLAVFLLRLGLVLLPSFPSIDAEFHAHNVERFRNGEVLKSRAPGAERGESLSVPYPPALYAMLAVLPPTWEGTTGVRVATALLEGTAPLLVFLVLRAAGVPAGVAAWGAAASASLPEGVLVLGKGIAANILASWTTLLVAWAWVRRSSPALLAALLAATFLSHWGVSLCLGILLVWLLVEKDVEDRKGLLLAALLAAGVAWVVYYREVLGLATGVLSSLGGHLRGAPAHFLRLRPVRVGKTLQDLVLKFGGSLALLGMTRGEALPPRLRALLGAWFGAGIVAGLLALLTPVPLRFEYFLTAPVALRAAFGAERLHREGRRRTLLLLLGVGVALELLIGGFLVFQRFDLLSVIQESESWTFPFYFCGRTSG